MNLTKELALIHGKSLCAEAAAAITLPYRIEHGIKGRIISESDKQAVIEIERAKLGKQTGLIDEPPPKQTRQPSYSKQYEYKTLTLFTQSEGIKTRQVIKLERFYIDALESIGVDKKAAWLSDAIAIEWNQTTGDKSIAKMVKASIVHALLERATLN